MFMFDIFCIFIILYIVYLHDTTLIFIHILYNSGCKNIISNLDHWFYCWITFYNLKNWQIKLFSLACLHVITVFIQLGCTNLYSLILFSIYSHLKLSSLINKVDYLVKIRKQFSVLKNFFYYSNAKSVFRFIMFVINCMIHCVVHFMVHFVTHCRIHCVTYGKKHCVW